MIKCYRCHEPEEYCVCETCGNCFEKINEGVGHVCLICNRPIDSIACDNNIAQCDSCAGIE